MLALSARLEVQDAQLAALAERVGELEQRLKRDSRNSSLPPSHDPPWLGKRGRSRGTGRKQGGQPGHPGHGRSLFPIERVTEVVEQMPTRSRASVCSHDNEKSPFLGCIEVPSQPDCSTTCSTRPQQRPTAD